MERTAFVGLDVRKRTTAVAIAEPGRGGDIRFLREIASTPQALHRLVEPRRSGTSGSASLTKPVRAATACIGCLCGLQV